MSNAAYTPFALDNSDWCLEISSGYLADFYVDAGLSADQQKDDVQYQLRVIEQTLQLCWLRAMSSEHAWPSIERIAYRQIVRLNAIQGALGLLEGDTQVRDGKSVISIDEILNNDKVRQDEEGEIDRRLLVSSLQGQIPFYDKDYIADKLSKLQDLRATAGTVVPTETKGQPGKSDDDVPTKVVRGNITYFVDKDRKYHNTDGYAIVNGTVSAQWWVHGQPFNPAPFAPAAVYTQTVGPNRKLTLVFSHPKLPLLTRESTQPRIPQGVNGAEEYTWGVVVNPAGKIQIGQAAWDAVRTATGQTGYDALVLDDELDRAQAPLVSHDREIVGGAKKQWNDYANSVLSADQSMVSRLPPELKEEVATYQQPVPFPEHRSEQSMAEFDRKFTNIPTHKSSDPSEMGGVTDDKITSDEMDHAKTRGRRQSRRKRHSAKTTVSARITGCQRVEETMPDGTKITRYVDASGCSHCDDGIAWVETTPSGVNTTEAYYVHGVAVRPASSGAGPAFVQRDNNTGAITYQGWSGANMPYLAASYAPGGGEQWHTLVASPSSRSLHIGPPLTYIINSDHQCASRDDDLINDAKQQWDVIMPASSSLAGKRRRHNRRRASSPESGSSSPYAPSPSDSSSSDDDEKKDSRYRAHRGRSVVTVNPRSSLPPPLPSEDEVDDDDDVKTERKKAKRVSPQRPGESNKDYAIRLAINADALKRVGDSTDKKRQQWNRIGRLMGHDSPDAGFTINTFSNFIVKELPPLLKRLRDAERSIRDLENQSRVTQQEVRLLSNLASADDDDEEEKHRDMQPTPRQRQAINASSSSSPSPAYTKPKQRSDSFIPPPPSSPSPFSLSAPSPSHHQDKKVAAPMSPGPAPFTPVSDEDRRLLLYPVSGSSSSSSDLDQKSVPAIQPPSSSSVLPEYDNHDVFVPTGDEVDEAPTQEMDQTETHAGPINGITGDSVSAEEKALFDKLKTTLGLSKRASDSDALQFVIDLLSRMPFSPYSDYTNTSMYVQSAEVPPTAVPSLVPSAAKGKRSRVNQGFDLDDENSYVNQRVKFDEDFNRNPQTIREYVNQRTDERVDRDGNPGTQRFRGTGVGDASQRLSDNWTNPPSNYGPDYTRYYSDGVSPAKEAFLWRDQLPGIHREHDPSTGVETRAYDDNFNTLPAEPAMDKWNDAAERHIQEQKQQLSNTVYGSTPLPRDLSNIVGDYATDSLPFPERDEEKKKQLQAAVTQARRRKAANMSPTQHLDEIVELVLSAIRLLPADVDQIHGAFYRTLITASQQSIAAPAPSTEDDSSDSSSSSSSSSSSDSDSSSSSDSDSGSDSE
jgi:hypothetical protein